MFTHTPHIAGQMDKWTPTTRLIIRIVNCYILMKSSVIIMHIPYDQYILEDFNVVHSNWQETKGI